MRWLTLVPYSIERRFDRWQDVDMENFAASSVICDNPQWLTARAFTRFITFLEVMGD